MKVSTSVMGAVSVCAVILMAGCGGSSGSSAAAGSVPTLPALNVPAADANTTTGAAAANMILNMDYTSGLSYYSATLTSHTGFNPVSYVKQQVSKTNKLSTSSANPQPYASQSTSASCTDGGTYGLTMSVNDAETKVVFSIVYNDCNESGIITNGEVVETVEGDLINYSPTSNNLVFMTDFSVQQSGVTYTIHKGTFVDDSYTQYDVNYVWSGEEKSSLWVDINGTENYRYDNLSHQFNLDLNNGTQTFCYQAGRIYVDNLTAYLDVDTNYDPNCNYPFSWSYGMLQSGSMQLLGSNGSKILVAADGNGSYTVTVQ